MKITLKQKVQQIEAWLDNLREKEQENLVDKDNLTVPVGTSKVFLDKNNKSNDKILVDYLIIKRSELSMVDTRIIETIFKLSQKK